MGLDLIYVHDIRELESVPTPSLLLYWIKEFKVHYVCLLTECSANSILTRSIKKRLKPDSKLKLICTTVLVLS